MSGLMWDKAFALEQAADDEELLEELIDIFKESFAADVVAIEQGLDTDSAEKIGAAAHSIKGAAASLGIEGISQEAKLIEEDCRSGNTGVARAKISILKNLLGEVLAL